MHTPKENTLPVRVPNREKKYKTIGMHHTCSVCFRTQNLIHYYYFSFLFGSKDFVNALHVNR